MAVLVLSRAMVAMPETLIRLARQDADVEAEADADADAEADADVDVDAEVDEEFRIGDNGA
jgi:hypothetical protein